MSDTIDVTLEQLLAKTLPNGELYLGKVIQHNTRKDGSLKDPGLLRRMDNDICRKCHAQYQEKYPDQSFDVRCHGIYDVEDYIEKQEQFRQQFPDDEAPSIESIRETLDVAYWSSQHVIVKNDDGDLVPFVARWYQEETLRCTARHKVDRWGRGLGKTTCGVIEELHKVINNKNYEILVVCPADSQSEKWYNEINLQLENSPTLHSSLASQKQQPFKIFRFHNGSSIAIFTAGSASGRGANAVRSQSPRRIRAEEQDYLAEKDWEALDPLIQRYDKAASNPSEFHGSSTPTGDRGKFWEMCNKFTRYREFYFPITVHPDWDEEMELTCRQEAKTEDRYQHEYLAEFGDPASGVFKKMHVDAAMKKYADPDNPRVTGYNTCHYDPAKRHIMGVDWNGEGTGTRIRVVSFDPETKIRRVVAKRTVDSEGWTTTDSIQAIVEMQKAWHCEDVYVDHGFGFAQDELLRMAGHTSADPDVRRLKDIKVIDFGALLETNAIVPKRDPMARAVPKGKEKDEELQRRTKPFMVEGTVMLFEHRLIEFSDTDALLEEQLRAYRVDKYSVHGYANSYKVEGKCGDHDLDALMLALLGIELTYGLFQNKEAYRRLAQLSHVTTFGTVQANLQQSEAMAQKREIAGMPSRSKPRPGQTIDEHRIAYLMRGGAYVVSTRRGQPQRGPIPSRTAIFRPRDPRDKGRR
jgi:hypothetical protein